jgi:hypothetical protein
MKFIAIEVLEGRAHTYRHDLESFFYVFLWVIIRYGQETDKNLPNMSRLRRWYAGSHEDIVDIKRSHMDKSRFKGILNELWLRHALAIKSVGPALACWHLRQC